MCAQATTDPLQRRFAEYCEFLADHPPPQMMLWVLVELLGDVADMVTVLEARQEEELTVDGNPSDVQH